MAPATNPRSKEELMKEYNEFWYLYFKELQEVHKQIMDMKVDFNIKKNINAQRDN